MSEVKRATLISFGSQKVSDKKAKGSGKTKRISLVLPESNEDTCPEYNYKEELAAAKKRETYKNKNVTTNGVDNIDDDEDVKRIAREMEAKYGIGLSLKKKKKGRKDDYADIGMGYDESDSFIDNTDGYDEMIPQHVTTLHGGFYINCGALEFKTDEEASSDAPSSSSEENTVEKSSSRKRILSSSDDSEREKETDKLDNVENRPQKKLKHSHVTNDLQRLSKKMFRPDKIKHMKKRSLEHKRKSSMVRELLKETRIELNMSIPQELNNEETPEDNKEGKEPCKPLTTEDLADITDTIEKVVKGGNKAHNQENTLNKNSVDAPSKPLPLSSEGESSLDGKFDEVKVVKLPENLSPDILNIINNIKRAAATSREGKVKFFTPAVNSMLLSLERNCKCLGKQSRMKVYEHLASFVKCRKETLIKRARNLVVEQEEHKLKKLMNSLKTRIDSVMPAMLEHYESESQKVVLKKFSRESEENEDNKALRMPFRRFNWNEDMKKMVKDIAITKKRCLVLEGKQKDSLESRLNEFLKKDVQTLWPDGWMSMTVLTKICSTVLDSTKSQHHNATKNNSNNVNSSVNHHKNKDTPQSLPKCSVSSSLSITPVPLSAPSVNKPNNSDSAGINKALTALPDIEISKTSAPSNNLVKQTPERTFPSSDSVEKPSETFKIKPESVENILEGKNIQAEIIPKHNPEVIDLDKPQNLTSKNNAEAYDRCQIIDLTGASEQLRRKPGPKSKTRYYNEQDKQIRKTKHDEITGSFALDQIITNSLSDGNNYSNSAPRDLSYAADYSKIRTNSEGDDIQKVMEGLKVLQKMSSPAKSADNPATGSPVSVIAYNKNCARPSSSPSGSSSGIPKADLSKADFCTGFQDAFQKQLLGEVNFMKAAPMPQAASGAQKNSYNSMSKYPHISNSGNAGLSSSDKYMQNSNNNFTQQNSSKVKSHLSTQQPGPYSNMLDDMFTNLLSEYGYSKAAAQNKNRSKGSES